MVKMASEQGKQPEGGPIYLFRVGDGARSTSLAAKHPNGYTPVGLEDARRRDWLLKLGNLLRDRLGMDEGAFGVPFD